MPLAVKPTKTKVFATFISSKDVSRGTTHEIHFLPRLSVLAGGIPLTDISSIPLSFVFIM